VSVIWIGRAVLTGKVTGEQISNILSEFDFTFISALVVGTSSSIQEVPVFGKQFILSSAVKCVQVVGLF